MSNFSHIIIPTVGRVVWFYPASKTGEAGFACNESGGPYAAIVARVWNDSMVNLAVFDANGTVHSRTSVHLVQGDEPAPDSAFCGWMPFQKGQAAKQDAQQAKDTNGGPRFRTHRDELEQSAAHAIATRVAELGANGARIGHEVRQALDALVNYGAKAAEPAAKDHASRVLYPAIRNAMEELGTLHHGFNDRVNRAWNYLHSAFYSESPAPASAPGLRCTLAKDETLVRLQVRDDHREEPVVAAALDSLRGCVHNTLDDGLMHHMTGTAGVPRAVTETELAAKAVGPRVTEADIEAAIASEHYFTAGEGIAGRCYREVSTLHSPRELEHVTVCVLILHNGTKLVGVNEGPVSPENFDPEIGRRYAREKAIDQVWPLLGYELRTRLAGSGT